MSDKKDTAKATTNTAWGGRFSEQTDAFVEAFTASVQFDQRLYRQDIAGSRAHAKMLNKIAVLSDDD
jgi:argininosuccinate lyase